MEQQLTIDTKLRGSSLPRKPVQRRSRERFEVLLNSTDALLALHPVSEVGLYDIAQHAGLAPASVYHFFASPEAAFTALAERYYNQLEELNAQPLPPAGEGWQQFIRAGWSRAIQFYNDNPVFMSLVLGGAVSPEIRQCDLAFNDRVAKGHYKHLNSVFVMPYLEDEVTPFYVILAIFDGIATTSYCQYGRITDDYRDEMICAIIAYLRTRLPETLPVREGSGSQ